LPRLTALFHARFGSETKGEWRVLADHWLQRQSLPYGDGTEINRSTRHDTSINTVQPTGESSVALRLTMHNHMWSHSTERLHQTCHKHPLGVSSRATVKHPLSYTVPFARGSSRRHLS
jgi:hypothetical protein